SPSGLPPLFPLLFAPARATAEIYTLSLHDALPIWKALTASRWGRAGTPFSRPSPMPAACRGSASRAGLPAAGRPARDANPRQARSEEHTSELQSRRDLVCRLLLEKKTSNNTETDNT